MFFMQETKGNHSLRACLFFWGELTFQDKREREIEREKEGGKGENRKNACHLRRERHTNIMNAHLARERVWTICCGPRVGYAAAVVNLLIYQLRHRHGHARIRMWMRMRMRIHIQIRIRFQFQLQINFHKCATKKKATGREGGNVFLGLLKGFLEKLCLHN